MNPKYRRLIPLVSLGIAFTLFSGNEGCNVNFNEDDQDQSHRTGGSIDDSNFSQEDVSEDRLLVSGSGEIVSLEYNEHSFQSHLNYDSGLYFFAPDPEGAISGDKIICAAAIDGRESYDAKVETDCFRTGHVCHVTFTRDWGNNVKDKDPYFISSSSCKEGGDLGPFLVPLESPLCGQDPFPACPSEDLFPTGPEQPAPETQPT